LAEKGFDFTDSLEQINVRQTTIDEKYTMPTGKRLRRRNHCTESVHSFKNASGETIDIAFRVYDDAVAFSYRLHNEGGTSVLEEISSFDFQTIEHTWTTPYSSSDERIFAKTPAGPELEKTSLSFPVLVETQSGKWALVSESDVSDYPLSSGQFSGNQLQYVFSNDEIAENTIGPDFVSPWRVMILGDDLGSIVESCAIDHLAPPTKMKDLSWIEPGVTSFPWWGNNWANSYPDTLRKYIDLSAHMGWRFMEFDIPLLGSPDYAAEKWKSVDWIKDVVDYGLQKGVLCYGWDDIDNLDTPEKRKDIFTRYNEFGVRGIKVDFVNSYTQETRTLVEEVIQDAARHRLMVSFHGAQSPRGFARTYPHVVTFEAVKGSEYYLPINGGKGVPPTHNCILPFTRNVLGSMDYTPVAFSSKVRTTTMAHELALSIVFESGWQGICDVPEAYLGSVAEDFLSRIRATWDETRFLDGYPGEYYCIARRKGDTWYIAGINAGEPRTVTLDLPATASKKVTVYIDTSEDLHSLGVAEYDVTEKPFEITMKRNGGFAFRMED
jgi:alpha-glucosidase